MGCKRCGDEIEHHEDHPEQCCDCFDISWGHPLFDMYLEVKEKLIETKKALAEARARITNLEDTIALLD